MSQKDYILLASVLRESKPKESDMLLDDAMRQWRRDVYRIADALQNDRYQFKMGLFLEACGYD